MPRIESFRPRSPTTQRSRWRPLRALFAWTLTVAVVGGLAWAGWSKLLDPTFLPIQVVGIEGELRHLRPDDLRQQLSPLLQTGLIGIDVHAVATAVESLPWVEQVTVRRMWPDKLELTIQEFTPLARWNELDLVNAEGVAFTPSADQIPNGLPWLWGPEGSSQRVTARYLTMSGALEELGLELRILRLNERRSWSFETADGMQVKIGQIEVEQRFQRLLVAYPQLRDRRSGEVLMMDFRYPNGVAVRWSSGSFRK